MMLDTEEASVNCETDENKPNSLNSPKATPKYV